MSNKLNQNKKQQKVQKNPLESLLEPVFGNYTEEGYQEFDQRVTQVQSEKISRRRESVFNFREHYEKESVQHEIQQLQQAIRQEIEAIKKSGTDLSHEVRQIDKLTVEDMPNKVGVYHVRFLEVMLSLLRSVREKIGDSKTWLQAMISRKQKRGSLFAVRSKKMGTQYSLSQELQSARSVQ